LEATGEERKMSDDPERSWEERPARPHRHLSPAEVERETARLLRVCTRSGVEAVIPDVTAHPELLGPLAVACVRAGLVLAAQYLRYLELPYD
jgi:hypothetical protein